MNFVVHVFGKQGCTKCDALKKRLARIMEDEAYANFSMEYHDVSTESGIVEFCKAGCLNPNRIPAMLVADEDGYITSDRIREDVWTAYGDNVTYQFVGLQTDYDKGHGVITPAAIEQVLSEALGTVDDSSCMCDTCAM